MPCPVCDSPTAPNAFGGDDRCGPCHNFRVVRLDGYCVILKVDFEKWISGVIDGIERARNLTTFRPWLHALRLAHERQVKR